MLFRSGYLVATGHGEQPLALQNPVPGLDGVAGSHWDGPLPRLDLGPQLTASFPVGVSVSLICRGERDISRAAFS